MTRQISFRDVEKLSSYLDGQLSASEAKRLESRLVSDPVLVATLDAMHQSQSVLRRLPQRRAPRNFTLTPRMAGLRAPTPRAVPALRFATILATALLAITFAANTIAPIAATSQAPMAYGIGGGGGGAEGPAERPQSGGGGDVVEAPAMEEPVTAEAALAAEAPQEPAAPTVDQGMPTATPESNDAQYAAQPTQSLKVPETSTEAVEQAMQPVETPIPSGIGEVSGGAEGQQSGAGSNVQVIPSAWQIGLFAVAVILGLAALFLYWNSQRKFLRKLPKTK